MIEPKRIELSVKAERAILIRTILPDQKHEETPLLELDKLARTAGAVVVENVVQNRQKVDPVYYLGKGKANVLADLCEDLCASVIICDDDLSPSQVKNLEKLTDTKVIDRSELILDIFATHAKTKQARMQVELAQMEYMLPRLKHLWSHLERIEGGIGTRGPGEKQLEIDRRIAAKKVRDLKKRLVKFEKVKEQEIISRRNFTKISLVGYTNAGKSTLMNALTGAEVLIADKLFATLDTKTSELNLGNGKKALLSDTVGFINKLPHHLIASFNATLEETIHADLLLHVVDISSPTAHEQIESVNRALKQLGCLTKPTMMVLNKMDAIDDLSTIAVFKKINKDCVAVSSKTGEGIAELKKKLLYYCGKDNEEIELVCENTNGKFFSYIYENLTVLNKTFQGNNTHFDLLVSKGQLEKLKRLKNDISAPKFKIIQGGA